MGAAVLHPCAQTAEAAEGLTVLWETDTQVTQGHAPVPEPKDQMPYQARPRPLGLPGDGSSQRWKTTQIPDSSTIWATGHRPTTHEEIPLANEDRVIKKCKIQLFTYKVPKS